MKIKEFGQKHWREIVLALIAVLFFVSTSSFNHQTQEYMKVEGDIDFVKWLSPDETSNYIFAKLYAQTGNISIQEDYNLYTKDIMHPRSFRSDFGTLKPVSFLGIILIYGKIASIFGYKIIPYLTPLIAAVSIFFFFLLIRKIFDKNVAFISAVILSCFPAYTYYSARSMFHNVLLVDMLIIGTYFGIIMVERRDKGDGKLRSDWLGMIFASLSGFFIGLGVISRVSELLWILPVMALVWVFNVRKIGFVKFALFLSFLFLAILPNLYHNQILYGGAISGGYNEMNASIRNIGAASKGIVANAIESGEAEKHNAQLAIIRDSVFHFGIHPRQSLLMLKHYFVEMFDYIFWTAAIGFLIFFVINIIQTKKKHWMYLSSLLILSAILILYYGSWKFHDNPDPNSFTIGNSYTRYWLPVYLGSFPFAAVLIINISKIVVWIKLKLSTVIAKSKFSSVIARSEATKQSHEQHIVDGDCRADARNDDVEGVRDDEGDVFFSLRVRDSVLKFAVQGVVVIIIMFLSVQYVLFGSEEGLVYTVQKQSKVKAEWERVIELTPHNSTLITRYHDKLFFPERKVIMGEFADQNMVAEYRRLAEFLPIYYYNFNLPDVSIKWLNEKRLGEVGLGIKEIEKITKDFTLYKLYRDDTYYVKPAIKIKEKAEMNDIENKNEIGVCLTEEKKCND
jgi:hypothetical protein